MSKLSRALFTVVLGVALVAPSQSSPAAAAISAAAASSALSTATGTVRIYGSTNQTFTNPAEGDPFRLGSLQPNKNDRFYIQNNGSISTPAFKMKIELASDPTITSLMRCDVGVLFTETAGECASGTATTIAITEGVLTTITLLMAPNTFYNLEIEADRETSGQVSLSVRTSQLGTRTINS